MPTGHEVALCGGTASKRRSGTTAANEWSMIVPLCPCLGKWMARAGESGLIQTHRKLRKNPYESCAEIMAKHKMLLLGDFLREKRRFFGYVLCRSLKSTAHPPWGGPHPMVRARAHARGPTHENAAVAWWTRRRPRAGLTQVPCSPDDLHAAVLPLPNSLSDGREVHRAVGKRASGVAVRRDEECQSVTAYPCK
jgi:hypothetical protein